MANGNLHGLKVAILATDGFEQVELLEPRKALDEAGAQTTVVSPKQGKIKGWNHKEWGNEVSVDASLKSSNPEDFDALLLPGGVMNPDHLRMDPEAVSFVRHFVDQSKPIAAICHGRDARCRSMAGTVRRWRRDGPAGGVRGMFGSRHDQPHDRNRTRTDGLRTRDRARLRPDRRLRHTQLSSGRSFHRRNNREGFRIRPGW